MLPSGDARSESCFGQLYNFCVGEEMVAAAMPDFCYLPKIALGDGCVAAVCEFVEVESTHVCAVVALQTVRCVTATEVSAWIGFRVGDTEDMRFGPIC